MEKLNNEYDVLKAQLKALGGDDTQDFDSKYQVMVAILEAIKQGGGGGGSLTPEQVRAIVESYNYMNQKKLTLNGDDPLQILDEDGNALTYAQVKALVDNKALFVYLLVDNAFYIPCGDMVVPSGHNAVEFSSAFIVSGEASIARIIIDTENEVLYEQYWLADKDWIRQQGYLTDTQIKTINGESIVGEGDIKVGDVKVIDTKNKFPYIECTAGKATIYLVLNGGITSPQFEYSYDKSNWMPFNSNVRIDMQVGETIYLKGSSDTLSTSASSYVSFGCDTTLETYPSFTIGGDFGKLVSYTAYSKNYCYYGLFIGSNQSSGTSTLYMGDYITKIADMSVTASEHGCDNMFAYSDIVSVDNLSLSVSSSSKSYQFNNMFNYCKNLTHAHITCPSSINSNRHAFANMFSGCDYLQNLYFGVNNASAGNFDSIISDGGLYVDVKERIIYTDVSSSSITIPSQWTKIATKYFGVDLRYAETTYAKKSEVPATDDFYSKDEFVNIGYGIEVMGDGADKASISIPADMIGTIQMLDSETDEYVDWNAYSAKRASLALISQELTQAEYDALEYKDPQTLYIITDQN